MVRKLAIAHLGALILTTGGFAADESFCRDYAREALAQAELARERALPVDGPRWLADEGAHYAWCLLVPQSVAEGERQARRQELGQVDTAPPPPATQPPSTATIVGVAAIEPPTTGTIVGVTVADPRAVACTVYADAAVAQFQEARRLQCGFTGSRWSATRDHHASWCQRVEPDLAAAEADARERALESCRATAATGPSSVPLLVPGLVLALRHDACANVGPEVKKGIHLFQRGNTTGVLSLLPLQRVVAHPAVDHVCGGDAGGQKGVGFQWGAVKDLPASPGLLAMLPPGLVLALHRSPPSLFTPSPSHPAFGEVPEHYPEARAYPGPLAHLMTHFGGDRGAPANTGFFWFETDPDDGEIDWSLVDRLPRYTIVGLKHTLNQPGKTLRWRRAGGVGFDTYDPACRDCPAPEGFVRVGGGDQGAPSGEGFVWYEKVIGPILSGSN